LIVNRRDCSDASFEDQYLHFAFAGIFEPMLSIGNVENDGTWLNLMDQYHPAFKAHQYPRLNRLIKKDEYRLAVQWALEAGLHRLDDRRALLWVIN
jgi:hypothetical protein